METITIEYQPNFKEKLMTFLNLFSENEIRIVGERTDVSEITTQRVHESYRNLRNGETILHSFAEVDAILDQTIAEYGS